MATYIIPLDSVSKNYSTRVTLDEEQFIIDVLLNSRDNNWYVDVKSDDGTYIVAGVKLLVGTSVIGRSTSSKRPPGEIFTISTNSSFEPPGKDGLGSSMLVTYISADDELLA